jgi:hypothetical protein
VGACEESLAGFKAAGAGRGDAEAWADLAHALMTTSEFIHVR